MKWIFNRSKNNNSSPEEITKTFDKLQKYHTETPIMPALPSMEDITEFERENKISFPNSYRVFLSEYSNLSIGTYELFSLNKPNYPYRDLKTQVEESRVIGLPKHYFPFMQDNGDYFCFDLKSKPEDYEIIFWSHDGMFKEERWDNFIDWVENNWIKSVSK